MNANIAALVLRVSFGGMMITHGWSKFQNLISGSPKFADPIGIGEIPTLVLAVLTELICPILIILGFKTKLAALPPAVTMLVAAFIIHGDDPWGKKEFALLYFAGFLALIFLGGGKYGLDRK